MAKGLPTWGIRLRSTGEEQVVHSLHAIDPDLWEIKKLRRAPKPSERYREGHLVQCPDLSARIEHSAQAARAEALGLVGLLERIEALEAEVAEMGAKA
jgi:hypothetical protein